VQGTSYPAFAAVSIPRPISVGESVPESANVEFLISAPLGEGIEWRVVVPLADAQGNRMTMPEDKPTIAGDGSAATPRCELVFGNASPERPESGELCVAPVDRNEPGARERSRRAVEHALAAFSKGDGPIRRIVVPLDPTLDDMLAATFCAWLLAGRQLPAGAEKFARYAAMVRESLRPSSLPLEATLEGIFMAIRNISGEDLAEPAVAGKFTADWWRMSDRIMQAAVQNLDPLTSRLFDDIEFARERTYLLNDHQVFLEDLARGETWTVELHGSKRQERAVLLRQPKSLLFKYFCRSSADVPGAEAFALMAVQWGPGEWVFSTDPVRRVSLKGLYDVLQAAEQARDPQRAESDPWFDGKPFQHTLVAGPKGKSILPDDEIVRIARRWSHARPERNHPRRKLVFVAAAAAGVLCLGGWLAVAQFGPAPQIVRGLDQVPEPEPVSNLVGPRRGKDYALLIAIENYQHPQAWQTLGKPIGDATELKRLLETRYGFEVALLTDLDGKDILHAILEKPKKNYEADDQLFIFVAGHGRFVDKIGYIVGKDAPSELDKNKYVSLNDVKATISNHSCPHVLLALDTCYGATIDTRVAGDIFSAMRGLPLAQLSTRGGHDDRDAYIAGVLQYPTRRFLASGCGPVPDKSSFLAWFLKFLGQPGDAPDVVTFSEITARMRMEGLKPIPAYGRLENDQESGDFLFIRRDDTPPHP
jgi:hypothetical protein